MKKKLVRGIIATVLALALAIGGTLMLFTSYTSTATNVVTLGNLLVTLQEKDDGQVEYQIIGDEYAESDELDNGTYVDGVFKGIDFGTLKMGQTVKKYSKVVADDDNEDAYLAIRADIDITGIESTSDVYAKVYAGIASLLAGNEVNTSATNTDGYLFYKADVIEGVADYLHGWFYWVTANDAEEATLAVFAHGDEVQVIEPLVIPLDWDNDFQGIGLEIELTAYAVQTVADVAAPVGAANWSTPFNAAFFD
jgi:predicted ribosomally synthesized peptide with SipW-like signal peptide